jgi:mycofactocin precursor
MDPIAGTNLIVDAPTDRTVADVDPTPATTAAADDGLLVDELLVEEISIDGMCGVY